MLNDVRVRAPEFAPDACWLNTGGKALALRELRGQVVLLDFWTYGCVNCLHVLPDLGYLEKKYAGRPFVVIGVHSGKFDNEKDMANLRNAVLRHGIEHPVVCDEAYRVWRSYAVRAWPTLVLIDSEGYVAGTVSGENHRDVLDRAVAELLRRAAGQGTGGAGAPRVFLERDGQTPTPLSFPGKVLTDGDGARLFVADSGHNRCVVGPLAGGNRREDYTYIGDGEQGFVDGAFETCRFRSPQGIALSPDGRVLYVADTENHAIRRVDLTARTVTTIAGTGRQASGAFRAGAARAVDLNSPWDLLLVDDDALYIAMAGSHQIGLLHISAQRVLPFAGTGREARADGAAHEAAFAQPSGLATDGERLFVADAESSCIRSVGLGAAPRVETLVGGDLFDFGNVDGAGDAARLQHPLGVAWDAATGTVFVADTYNHRVRHLDPVTRRIALLAGAGQTSDLYEPGGLSPAGGTLYVADTNNHRVRTVDPATGAMGDWPMGGLCAPDLCFPETNPT